MVCIVANHSQAQFIQNGIAYYTTADYTLNTDISGNDVFVGKDTAFNTLPGTVTLTVATGATVTGYGATYPGPKYYESLNVFGNHRTNITGGSVMSARGYNNSTVNITGGSVSGTATGFDDSTVNITGGSAYYAFGIGASTINITGGSVTYAFGIGASTINITGGSVTYAFGNNVSTTNISGGSVDYAEGFNFSTTNITGGNVTYAEAVNGSVFNINGGTLTNGILLFGADTRANFVGTGLSFAYQSYGNNNPYNVYADFFQISGNIGGLARMYDLYIYNPAGESGTPDSAQRRFNLVAPVVVPEAGTLALLLPALALVGGAFVARRRTA